MAKRKATKDAAKAGNQAKDVVAELVRRQAGMQITPELIAAFETTIAEEGDSIVQSAAGRLDQLGRLADLAQRMVDRLQPPHTEFTAEQEEEAAAKEAEWGESPEVTVEVMAQVNQSPEDRVAELEQQLAGMQEQLAALTQKDAETEATE